MGGSCVFVGSIAIGDPDYYMLRLASGAVYYVSGQTHIDLYGNIE